MNTTGTDDRADEELRAMLAQADPMAGAQLASTDHLLDRVRSEVAAGPQPDAELGRQPEPGLARPSWLHRHWQGSLLVAAGVAALALAAPTVLPGVVGGNDATDEVAGSSVELTDDAAAMAPGTARNSELSAAEATGGSSDALSAVAAKPGAATASEVSAIDEALVRSASLLVGTDEIEAQRDAFVTTILALGGRVTSETVVTESAQGNSVSRNGMLGNEDLTGSAYSYPWYATGPGIWLSVEVPVDNYDQAVGAARSTGEVVQMQQSSYDVGTRITDVDARIAALEASLARLTDLMGSAEGVSDVIALEQAIASRQAELDSLRAQQRDLANQTAMSRISLTLMSPEDARGTVDPSPDPQPTLWESFLEGLGQFWSWLGHALLIVSPLLIAIAIIRWVRRRQARSSGSAESQEPTD